jgi:pimeloyl-ACP methyl ester carboxylesterase
MRVEVGQLTGGLPFVAVGNGPPLVVLSGLSAEHGPPSSMERRPPLRTFGPRFQRAFRVHLVSRRAGLPPGTTMADLAEHVAVAVRADLPAPVRLVGISTGGSIALQTAIDHPDVVDRLVLLSAACRLSDPGRKAQRRLADHTLAGQHRAAWAALAPMLATGRAARAAFTALLWAFGPISAPHDPSDMVATIRAEDAFDAAAELERVTSPTLVIGGAHDGFYAPALFAATARGIHDARLLLQPRGTHISVLRDHDVQLELARFLR